MLTEAFAINDTGEIVGKGSIGGETHAFLLTQGGPPVPAPGALLLGIMGATGALVLHGLRKRNA